jgi:hypothetical protein
LEVELGDKKSLPNNDQTYVVMRTSHLSIVEKDLFIEVAFKCINNPSDAFVIDVSILEAMLYRPSTLWLNGKMIGVITSQQVEKLTKGKYKLIQSSYQIDPAKLAVTDSFSNSVPTKLLHNNQVKFQSMELVFATYGAHELIQDLIRFSPYEVLKIYSKSGYDSPSFGNSNYEIYLKKKTWNHNVFAYTLIANIRHNYFVFDKMKRLNGQFFNRNRGKDKFLVQGVPCHSKPFIVSGNVLKNIQTSEEYLWSVTGASVDNTIEIKQFFDRSSSERSDRDIKSGSNSIRYFVSVAPEIVSAIPGRNDGEFVTPFKTTLIGSAPISIPTPVAKDHGSFGTIFGNSGADRVLKGSGNDPHGLNKGVATITTGTSQNDFFSDNMRLLVVASKHLVPSKVNSIQWVVNHDCGLFAEPVCLYFEKTDESKDWVVVAKKDNEESYRFVLLFQFNLNAGTPIFMLELDSDQACCVLFFRLRTKFKPLILRRIMQIIARKKGVMRHVCQDSRLSKLGVFKYKKHWTTLEETADKEKWIRHVANWLEERLDFDQF